MIMTISMTFRNTDIRAVYLIVTFSEAMGQIPRSTERILVVKQINISTTDLKYRCIWHYCQESSAIVPSVIASDEMSMSFQGNSLICCNSALLDCCINHGTHKSYLYLELPIV